MTPKYLIPGRSRNHIHAARDCHALSTADAIDEVRASDYPDRDRCQYCHGSDDDHPPREIACPCGYGRATLVTVTQDDYAPDRRLTATHHHYRHEGCPIGGTIITVGDEERRRFGPLFDPRRYRIDSGREAVAGD